MDAIGRAMKALSGLEPEQRLQVMRGVLGLWPELAAGIADVVKAVIPKSAGAVRQERYRKRRAGASPPSPSDVTGDVTSDVTVWASDVTRDVTGDAFPRHKGGRGVSLSRVSSLVSVSSEQIGDESVTDGGRMSSPGEDVVLFAMPETWELDEGGVEGETREAVKILGVADVDAAWAAFRSKQLDKAPQSRRAWLAQFRDCWAPRSRRFEAQDAARGVPRKGLARPVLVQPAPPGGSIWKSGDGT